MERSEGRYASDERNVETAVSSQYRRGDDHRLARQDRKHGVAGTNAEDERVAPS
jgi:hypothetical protein